MTITAVATHPILGAVATARAALGEVADVQPVFMSTAEKQAALIELSRAEAQITELRLRVLASSGEVGDDSGARDAAAWVSIATRTDPQVARADAHLAKALEARELVATGMREGAVSTAQARVIAAGLEALPKELGTDLLRDAEATLVGFCDDYRPIELRRLARRILDVVAPDIAEAEEGKRLEAEEQRAREKASLKFRDLGDGTTRIWGTLPTPDASRFKTYLHAYTSPRQPDSGGRGGCGATVSRPERIPQHRAHAHALAALLEHLDPATLPEHGGDATTVMITMTLEQLHADLATAGVLGNDEETISAEQARRLACNAAIIPAVLSSKSQVLDLGRTQRLFNRAQRKALRLRDNGCRAEGCTIPATWTEAHHLQPWSQGGTTDLANATSLCNHHHHRIHDRAFDNQRLPNGDIRFHRRR